MELCYMTRPEELAKHRRLVAINGGDPTESSSTLFEQMFEGDDNALAMAWAFWNFEHALDDALEAMDESKRFEVLNHVQEWVSRVLITGKKYAHPAPDLFSLDAGLQWDFKRLRLAEQAKRDFWKQLWDNPFVSRYRFELRAMFCMAAMRCIAGDEMKRDKHPLACAVACADVDVILHMVFLARGWEVANRFSIIRHYDVPDSVLEGGS